MDRGMWVQRILAPTTPQVPVNGQTGKLEAIRNELAGPLRRGLMSRINARNSGRKTPKAKTCKCNAGLLRRLCNYEMFPVLDEPSWTGSIVKYVSSGLLHSSASPWLSLFHARLNSVKEWPPRSIILRFCIEPDRDQTLLAFSMRNFSRAAPRCDLKVNRGI